jgi:hypothetical protein
MKEAGTKLRKEIYHRVFAFLLLDNIQLALLDEDRAFLT